MGMIPSQAAQAIMRCIDAGLIPFLHGAPGVGKTAIVQSKQLTDKYGPCETVHGLVMDSVDVHGFPEIVGEKDKRRTRFSQPSFFPEGSRGILFLDEFPAAPAMIQTAFSQLLLNHRINEHLLSEDWKIVLAGNRLSDRAVVHCLPTPIANRVVHIEFDPNLTDFTKHAEISGFNENVVAFVKFQPQYLHGMYLQAKNKEADKRQPSGVDYAFPSPRSWEFVSKLMETSVKDGEIDDVNHMLIEGMVGKAAACDFASHINLRAKAPRLEDIIANPMKTKIPKDISIRYAVALGLSRRIDKDTFTNIYKYLNRSDEAPGIEGDMLVMSVKTASERNPLICKMPEFKKFAQDHQESLFGTSKR